MDCPQHADVRTNRFRLESEPCLESESRLESEPCLEDRPILLFTQWLLDNPVGAVDGPFEVATHCSI